MGIINKLASFFNRRDRGDLKLFTEVVDETISTLGKDINLLELEYNLRTATGEWLDEWGSWFGVYRSMDEDDDSYRYRILTSLARATGTIPAIMNSVLEYYEVEYGKGKYTEADIKITEPYTLLKKFSECGEFSGTHRFPDSEFYRHHTIEIELPESVTPQLRQMVEKTKAGGIKVYYKVSTSDRPDEGGGNGVVSMTPSVQPISDNLVDIDMSHATIKYGMAHSTYAPPMNRTRSGRKILDTIDSIIRTDINEVIGHTYKEISEFWKIMCQYGHTSPVWVPPVDMPHNVLSESLGTRSGDKEGHWEHLPIEEVLKDAEDNILQLPVMHTKAYIRPAMRSKAGNGHSVGFPRSGLYGEKYDHTIKESFTSDTYVDAYWIMKDWSGSTIITTIEVHLVSDFELSIEKVFTTEHVHESQEFNVTSEVVTIKDNYKYVSETPYEDSLDMEVQPRVESEFITTVEVMEEQDKLPVITDVTNCIEMFTIDRDISAITHDGNEVLTSEGVELVISTKWSDTSDIEIAIFRNEYMDFNESHFSTLSPIIKSGDAGKYGLDVPFNEADKVQIQTSVQPIYIKTVTHTMEEEPLNILTDTGYYQDAFVMREEGIPIITDTVKNIGTSQGVDLVSVDSLVDELSIEMDIVKDDYVFLDEVQFNISSVIVGMEDAGNLATNIPLSEVVHLYQVQSDIQPVYTKYTSMKVESPKKLNVYSNTEVSIGFMSERCMPLDNGEQDIITSDSDRIAVGTSPHDVYDIEVDIDKLVRIHLDESMFNIASPSIGFKDAEVYGTKMSLSNALKDVKVNIQSSVMTIEHHILDSNEEDN